MIGAYIFSLILFILSFGITSVIILSLNTLHGTRRDEGHSTWFLKLVILFMCIASFKITYNIIDKPNTWFCTDEPIATNKNMETYVYYNFFQTDSVVKEVHKFEYIKAIITINIATRAKEELIATNSFFFIFQENESYLLFITVGFKDFIFVSKCVNNISMNRP